MRTILYVALTINPDLRRQQELEALKISTLFICYKIEKLIEYYLVITLICSMNKREEYCESIVILRDDNLQVMQFVLFPEIF